MLKQWSYDGSPNLQWQLVELGGGRYQIINRATGTCLDSGGDATVGARVKLWAPDASTNLQWTVGAV